MVCIHTLNTKGILFCCYWREKQQHNIHWPNRLISVQALGNMCYMYVTYVYKLNYILPHPVKIKGDVHMIHTFVSIYNGRIITGNKYLLTPRPWWQIFSYHPVYPHQERSTRKNTGANTHCFSTVEPSVTMSKYHILAHVTPLEFRFPI